jgi:hypothetical protein
MHLQNNYADNWSLVLTRNTFSGVKLRKSAAQAITTPPNFTYRTVTWDIEDFDTDGYHAAGAAAIVIPSSSYYLINVGAATGAGGLVFRVFNVFNNGSKMGGLDVAREHQPFAACMVDSLAAGASITVQCYTHTSNYNFGGDDGAANIIPARFECIRLGSNLQGVRLRRSTASGPQVINPGTPAVPVIWTEEVFDTAAFHTAGSDTIIIPHTGRYLIIANIQWYSALVIKQIFASLYINGVAVDGYRTQSDNQISRFNKFVNVRRLQKGDTVQIYVSHDGGGNPQSIVENQGGADFENFGSELTVINLDSIGA